MTGKNNPTKRSKEIVLDGEEKLTISKFLAGKSEKTVNLERILGIGGEGIVLSHQMDTRENHYKARKNWLGKNKAGCNHGLIFFSIYLKTRYSLINKACGRRKDSVKVVQQQKDLMDLSTSFKQNKVKVNTRE